MFCFPNCILYNYIIVKKKWCKSKSISRNMCHLFLQYNSLPVILLQKKEQPYYMHQNPEVAPVSPTQETTPIHISLIFSWNIINYIYTYFIITPKSSPWSSCSFILPIQDAIRFVTPHWQNPLALAPPCEELLRAPSVASNGWPSTVPAGDPSWFHQDDKPSRF